MAKVASFTFNPFQENTYIVYDETKECIIIDPGCYRPLEKEQLSAFISENDLKPVQLILTHCHVDHVLGNKFINDIYQLRPYIHPLEKIVLEKAIAWGGTYGIHGDESPAPAGFIDENSIIKFGNTELKSLFTPGHSPGSLSFYSEKDKFVIAGDVLFYRSIGRTDLPGGDYDVLMDSIKKTMFNALSDDFTVYSGHGPATNIGDEKKHNPFLRG
jgi:glyoxylase-like metal-dependent hydrolase (beta-lactamase superfamily II)